MVKASSLSREPLLMISRSMTTCFYSMRVLNLTDQQSRYVWERTDLYQEKEKNNTKWALIKTPNRHWGILFFAALL